MELIFKGMLAGFWLLLVPAFAGIPFLYKNKEWTFGESFLAGYLFLFSAAEILMLPMLYAELPLHLLTAAIGAAGILLAAAGMYLSGKKGWNLKARFRKAVGESSLYLWGAVLLIGMQIAVMVLLAHMDADDAFYVGTATTAVETDTIFSVDPYTGMDYAKRPSRYVLSPFPVFLAVVSQLCSGLHPAITAHVVYPAVFMLMAYLVLYQIGKKWFPGEKEARGIFLLLTAVLTWFSGYSIYNGGNFQMVRLWQGKALLAAAMLPLLLYLCLCTLMAEKEEYSYLLLGMANISCCLLSSMGVILSLIMTGAFCLLSLFWHRDWKKTGKGLLCCIPALLLGVLYILLKH